MQHDSLRGYIAAKTACTSFIWIVRPYTALIRRQISIGDDNCRLLSSSDLTMPRNEEEEEVGSLLAFLRKESVHLQIWSIKYSPTFGTSGYKWLLLSYMYWRSPLPPLFIICLGSTASFKRDRDGRNRNPSIIGPVCALLEIQSYQRMFCKLLVVLSSSLLLSCDQRSCVVF